jgi:GNAT superfamily N-acetyltransferase
MSNGYMVRPPRGDWEAGLSVEATMAGSAEKVGSVKDRSVDRSTALISELYVAPTHRRRGVSRKLMQAVLRAARGAGIYVLRLRARPESPQIGIEALLAFYREFGFRQTGSSGEGHPVLELRLTGVRLPVGSGAAAVQLRRVIQRMDDGQGWRGERNDYGTIP